MKLSSFLPAAGVCAVLLCAVLHVFFTVENYGTMLTAVPLWMHIALAVAFWIMVLLAGTVCYLIFSKYRKKK